MCTNNGKFPRCIGRLSYLVSAMATDGLTMQGARASAMMEVSQFSWDIQIPVFF